MTEKKKKKKQNKRGNRLVTIIIVIVFLGGAGFMLYPTFANLYNMYINSKAVTNYFNDVSHLSEAEKERIWNEAKEYNRHHTVNKIHDFYQEKDEYKLSHPYDTMLDPSGSKIMGSIEIPKINVVIAIHHGISARVLQQGAGHLEGTSLPIGGKGTHAVISAHRGLPSAKLFTDLDQIEIGDQFYLHVMDKHLAYEVDQIKTVLPEVTEDLMIEKGKDYMTLVTCTPYGVNSHRLLVRGHRVKYIPPEEKSLIERFLSSLDRSVIILLIGIGVFLLILIILKIRDRKKRKERKTE